MANPIAVLLALAACDARRAPEPEAGCGEATWDGFAGPVITTWCTPCHDSALAGESRRGAPEGLDFDGWPRAHAAAAAIAGAVGPDEPRMPPAGGLSDAERERLVRWAECGAPGPERPTAPDPCAERRARPGDASIADAPCASGAHNAVAGTLTVDADPGASLDCVCEIDGDLVVEGRLGEVRLPALRWIGGAIRIEGASVGRLALPGLESAGSIALVDADLPELALDRLAIVEGPVSIEGGALPATFGPPRLQEIAGALVITGTDRIETVDLPRLEIVGGDLALLGLPRLERIVHTSDLTSLGGSLRLVGNRALSSVEDFAFLVEVPGDLEIGGGGSLGRIEAFFSLERVSGGIWIHDAPELAFIGGLSHLRRVGGDLVLSDDGALLDPGAEALIVIEGSLVLERNASMRSLLGLRALRAIGGDLTIRDNPSLPRARIDRLLGDATVGGTTTVEGNGG